AAIGGQSEPPTFDNTILALEKSARALQRVDEVFGQLVGANSNDALLAIEREISPRFAKHWAKMRADQKVFARLDDLYRRRDSLGLTAEQKRLLERHHTMGHRQGAALDAAKKKRLADITERLAELGTSFSQNVLAEEQSYTMVLDGDADLAGLPDFVLEAA